MKKFYLYLLAVMVICLPFSVWAAAPNVAPSLQEWTDGSGTFSLAVNSRICVDSAYSAQLTDTANVFKEDLLALNGRNLTVVNTTSPAAGDFYLTLNCSDSGIGNEGYLLEIGNYLTIRARTADGAFYGTRTILQILKQDAAKINVPKGTARDYPKYRKRAFMIDVARKYFTTGFLQDYVKLMAWLKMNDFHIHWTDNESFRLVSDTYPGLASTPNYSKAEVRALQDLARKYHLTITPEIDTPGHVASITAYRPDLASPIYGGGFFDLNNPNVYTFMNGLYDEFAPFFDAPDFHLGTDEYAGDPGDIFRQYINRYADYLGTKGKRARIWTGYDHSSGPTQPRTNIIIDDWEGYIDVASLSAAGYDIINSSGDFLYIVPGTGWYPNCTYLYEQWQPYIFNSGGSHALSPTDPHLLGAKLHNWNDNNAYGKTETEIDLLIEPPLKILAEDTWGGPRSASYTDFQGRLALIGQPPGVQIGQPLKSLTDLVIYYKQDEGAGTTAGDSSGNNYHGTLNGPFWTTAGKSGRGLVFDGANDYISTNLPELATPWTASLWVKREDSTNGSASLMSSASCALKLEQFNNTNKVGFTKFGVADYTFNYTAPAGAWVHLSFVGTSAGTSLYVNGVFQETNSAAISCPLSYVGSSTEAFKGTLDDLKVYNRALSSGEIWTLANGNVALGKTVTASSVEAGTSFTADKAVDGNPTTRWSSNNTDPQWISVDLGQATGINRVLLNWETAYGKSYQIQVSNDAVNWTNVFSTTTGDGGIDDISFTAASARYVRMYGTQRGTEWGYSLWEFEVYKSAPPAGAAAYWRFNEGSGATATDSWGNNNGTLNGPVWTGGKSDNALLFDGINDYVSVGKADLATPWTAGMWVKREDSPAASSALLSSNNSALKLEQFNNTNKVGFTVFGVNDYLFNYTAPVGTWVHLTFVGTSAGTSLYVNGALQETNPAVMNCPMGNIGCGKNSADFLKGTLDEVKIYNRALSAGEIAALAQ